MKPVKFVPPPTQPITRSGSTRFSSKLHEIAPVGLRAVAVARHEYSAADTQVVAAPSQRAAPLPGSGVGNELGQTLFAGVIRLRNGSVGLVASRGREIFALEVNRARVTEDFLEPARPVNGSGPVFRVFPRDFFRNGDPGVRAIRAV